MLTMHEIPPAAGIIDSVGSIRAFHSEHVIRFEGGSTDWEIRATDDPFRGWGDGLGNPCYRRGFASCNVARIS
jgi:hypothetical protein